MSTLELISHQLEKIIVHLNSFPTYDNEGEIYKTLMNTQLEMLKEFVDNKIKEDEAKH